MTDSYAAYATLDTLKSLELVHEPGVTTEMVTVDGMIEGKAESF